ncbi:hypothetical protein CYMTET_27433, partial [Cymbomonas tetramitiformis]
QADPESRPPEQADPVSRPPEQADPDSRPPSPPSGHVAKEAPPGVCGHRERVGGVARFRGNAEGGVDSQEAQLEREYTESEVNGIQLESVKAVEIARSYADLVVLEAEAESVIVMETARAEGYANLTEALNITEERHKASFDYLYNIEKGDKIDLTATFLGDINVVKTSET